MVKDSDELALIRAAVQLGATLFDRALEILRPGIKETEVAAEMEYAARRQARKRCRFRPSLPRGQDRRCLTGELPRSPSLPVGS